MIKTEADELFKNKAFDCLEPERKAALASLYLSLKGKTPDRAVPIILSFMRSAPKGHNITPAERDAMFAAITADMDENGKRSAAIIMKMLF